LTQVFLAAKILQNVYSRLTTKTDILFTKNDYIRIYDNTHVVGNANVTHSHL